MKVQITDNHSYDAHPIVVSHRDVAETIGPWFADATAEIEQAIRDLQHSLNIAQQGALGTETHELSTTGLCAFLGITLRIADVKDASGATAIRDGELTQDEIDNAGKLCRAEGMPLRYAENVARILREVSRRSTA
jgi:hypothetical protein